MMHLTVTLPIPRAILVVRVLGRARRLGHIDDSASLWLRSSWRVSDRKEGAARDEAGRQGQRR